MALSRENLKVFEARLNRMLVDDINLTARSCVSQGLVKNASDITRIPARRELLEKYRFLQQDRRNKNKNNHIIKELRADLLKANQEINELKEQKEILLASHRALIAVVGEFGGIKSWKQSFIAYDKAMKFLEAVSETKKDTGNST